MLHVKILFYFFFPPLLACMFVLVVASFFFLLSLVISSCPLSRLSCVVVLPIGRNARFEGLTLQHVARLCGTDIVKEKAQRLPVNSSPPVMAAGSLPVNFDAREGQFGMCAHVIGHIRDQSDCGSCWAFGSTEAFNDRLCISSRGKVQVELSAQDTASCCTGFECGFSQGCSGGQPSAAWTYFQNNGVVTGGDYQSVNKSTSCWPYQLPTCDHHVNDPNFPNCTSLDGGNVYSIPSCRRSCDQGYQKTWSKDKYFVSNSYTVGPNSTAIQQEIFAHGPVTAVFEVYADFPGYKSGVYQHVTGGQLGGHAIKILGWGEENGTPYWLVANSWNEGWGDKGFFKILRGQGVYYSSAIVSLESFVAFFPFFLPIFNSLNYCIIVFLTLFLLQMSAGLSRWCPLGSCERRS